MKLHPTAHHDAYVRSKFSRLRVHLTRQCARGHTTTPRGAYARLRFARCGGTLKRAHLQFSKFGVVFNKKTLHDAKNALERPKSYLFGRMLSEIKDVIRAYLFTQHTSLVFWDGRAQAEAHISVCAIVFGVVGFNFPVFQEFGNCLRWDCFKNVVILI